MKQQLTNQTALDKMCKRFAKQQQRSMGGKYHDDEGCAYYGNNGARCAVGTLIPSRLYRRSMEGKTVSQLLCRSEMTFLFFRVDGEFLEELQDAHDESGRMTASELRSALYKIAKRYGLNPSAIDLITKWEGDTIQ